MEAITIGIDIAVRAIKILAFIGLIFNAAVALLVVTGLAAFTALKIMDKLLGGYL